MMRSSNSSSATQRAGGLVQAGWGMRMNSPWSDDANHHRFTRVKGVKGALDKGCPTLTRVVPRETSSRP